MKTIYHIKVLLFIICFAGISAASKGQCQMQFDYSVEKNIKKESDGKLYLILKEGSPSFEFRLFDLYQDKVVQVKTVNSMKVGEKTLIFQNVPNSAYLIHIYKKGCDKPLILGKLSGIVVDTNGQ